MKKRITKKVVGFLLALMLVLVTAAPALAAVGEKPVLVTVNGDSGKPGETVTVSVNVDTQDQNFWAGLLSLQFDKEQVEPVGVRGRYFKDGDFGLVMADGLTELDLGLINCAYTTGNTKYPVEGQGTLVTIDFKIKDDATKDSEIAFINGEGVQGATNIDNELVPLESTAGKIAVTVPVSGVTLTPEEVDIYKDTQTTLKAEISPAYAANQGVRWESSDPGVAEVQDGVVTGIKAGTAIVTATTEEGEFKDTCTVTVKDDRVTTITMKSNPKKTDYVVGQTFNPEGGVITADMEQGSTINVDLTSEMCTVDMNKAGEQNVTVNYGGVKLENAFKVNIVPKTVTSIEVIKTPTGFTYMGDGTVNLQGGEMKVSYNDESNEIRSLTEVAWVSGFDNKVAGKQIITINYGIKEADCEIIVLYKGTITMEDDTVITVYGTPESKLAGIINLHVNRIETPDGAVDDAKKQFGNQSEIKRALDIILTDAEGKVIKDTGKIRIGVKLTEDEIALAKEGRLFSCYVNDQGKLIKMDTEGYNGDGMLYFNTDHLSVYALVKAEESVNPPIIDLPSDSKKSEINQSSVVNPYTGKYFTKNEVNGFFFLVSGFVILGIAAFKLKRIKKVK